MPASASTGFVNSLLTFHSERLKRRRKDQLYFRHRLPFEMKTDRYSDLQQTHKKDLSRYSRLKKRLPINLLRKALREKRNRNELPARKRRQNVKKSKIDFRDAEHKALVQATEAELKKILSETDVLSDINYDCTPEELLGEIALAEGNATIIYVERDGLSTLTIVLPQESPTIANLKRAIESSARVQLRRELRQRHEERLQRRARTTTTALLSQISQKRDDKHEAPTTETSTTTETTKEQQTGSTKLESHIHSTGELVCSTTRNGHHHRSNVSWRFLWRAYTLFHIETNHPIDDSNGRRLLSECGIENATTLKFCKREKYFGRKRQQ